MTSEIEMAACEPQAVLPAQMSGGVRWDADTSGPRALMLAVLEDAVRCIERGRRRGHFRARRLAAEADAWVRCDRRGWPFSFVNICEVLGFDADAVRALLTRPSGAALRRCTGVNVRVRSPIRRLTVNCAPPARQRVPCILRRSSHVAWPTTNSRGPDRDGIQPGPDVPRTATE